MPVCRRAISAGSSHVWRWRAPASRYLLAAARGYRHPFRNATITTDARAACVGAHRGRDGGIIIVGTGSIGWADVDGRQYRVGGWGLPDIG